MATISLCMIAKNESAVLERCLSSIADLMDEIIIVDTGSSDNTKEIAAKFTDKIYDFAWKDDFAAARNFAFSKATMEYIYSADADEVVDSDNRKQFAILKQALLPEIEIVQMYYVTPPAYNTTSNYQKEYRPKLYRRLRTFTWQDPVHETVRLDPVVFDSDIEIRHLPRNLHSRRDFELFLLAFRREGGLSAKLQSMYAKELFISGSDEDFLAAEEVFASVLEREDASKDRKQEALCVLCHAYRVAGQTDRFFSAAFKLVPDAACAEFCWEIGSYFLAKEDYREAAQWFEQAAYRSEAIIDIRCAGKLPLEGLAKCYRGLEREAREAAGESEMPAAPRRGPEAEEGSQYAPRRGPETEEGSQYASRREPEAEEGSRYASRRGPEAEEGSRYASRRGPEAEMEKLADSYRETAEHYEEQARNWELPVSG